MAAFIQKTPTSRTNSQLEDNELLKFPRSSFIYSKMLREDSKVTSVFRAISLNITRASWWIDPAGCENQEILDHVSSDLGLRIKGKEVNVHRGGISWIEHLERALLSLIYGHAFFEQVYEIGEDGKDHLTKLQPRLSTSISKIEVGEDGVFDGIYQRVDGWRGGEEVFIPKSRLVAYIHAPVDLSWTGTSILRPAYKHWILKDELLRLEFTALDRNSLGVPVYRGSDFATAPGQKPGQDLEDGQIIAENLRSGDAAGAVIPAGADLKLLGINGQILSPRQAIEYHDRAIAEAALGHFMNLSDGGGSYALAEIQAGLFTQSLNSIADSIAETATEYILHDIIRLAYPNYTGPLPRISFDTITAVRDLAPQDLAAFVRDKVIIMDSPTDEYVRRKWGLPPAQSVDEAAAAILERGKIQEALKEVGKIPADTQQQQEVVNGGNSN